MPIRYYYSHMSDKTYPSDTQDRFMVRMPDGLRDRIAEVAKENNRSMNAELVSRIESSFEAKDQSALAQRVAHLELELLARQLDLAWFSTLITDVAPHIQQEVVDANLDLKANLKMLRRFTKKFALGKEDLERMDKDHGERLKQALSEMMEKKLSDPDTAPK